MKKLLLGFLFIIAGGIQFFRGGSIYGVQLLPKQGIIFCLVGLLPIISYIIEIRTPKKTEYKVCKKCHKKFNCEHVYIDICPICNGKLVNANSPRGKP